MGGWEADGAWRGGGGQNSRTERRLRGLNRNTTGWAHDTSRAGPAAFLFALAREHTLARLRDGGVNDLKPAQASETRQGEREKRKRSWWAGSRLAAERRALLAGGGRG